VPARRARAGLAVKAVAANGAAAGLPRTATAGAGTGDALSAIAAAASAGPTRAGAGLSLRDALVVIAAGVAIAFTARASWLAGIPAGGTGSGRGVADAGQLARGAERGRNRATRAGLAGGAAVCVGAGTA